MLSYAEILPIKQEMFLFFSTCAKFLFNVNELGLVRVIH